VIVKSGSVLNGYRKVKLSCVMLGWSRVWYGWLSDAGVRLSGVMFAMYGNVRCRCMVW
jgi:hypothetical protein